LPFWIRSQPTKMTSWSKISHERYYTVHLYSYQLFWTLFRIGPGFNQVSVDPDRVGQKRRPTKKGNFLEISCFEVLNVLFEGWRLLL
jgi:hypothetical protein